MKRFLAVLLAVMLMAVIMPMAAMAACPAGNPNCEGGYPWFLATGFGFHTAECPICKGGSNLPCISDGTATCQHPAKCVDCYDTLGPLADHNYNQQKYDATGHWKKCQWCDEVDGPPVSHSFTYSQDGDKCRKSCACGYSELVDHALTHTDAQAPTCTSVGWEAYDKCNNCGYSTYVEIPMLGHDVPNKQTVGATCTDTGSVHGICTRCNKDIEVEILPALGHKSAETWSTDEEYHWHDCLNVCGTRFDVGEHEPDTKIVIIQPATCEADGSQREDTYCKVCDVTLEKGEPTPIAKLGHDIDTDQWAYDNDNHWHPCTHVISSLRTRDTGTCPYRESEEPHVPKYEEWTPGAEATCYSKATETNVCDVCGAPMVREIGELVPHAYGEWVNDENGETHTKTCTTCPEGSAATVTEDHRMKPTEAGKAPTCTEAGWDPAQQCEVCGAVLDRVPKPATVHLNIKPVAGYDATCGKEGLKPHYTCTCGALFEDEDATVPTTLAKLTIPKTAHQNVNHIKAAAPTCTAKGNVEYWSCSDCGKLYLDAAMTKETTANDVLIKAVGHRFDKWKWTNWKHWQVCTVCGAESGHAAHGWIKNKEKSTANKIYYECGNCGAVKISYYDWKNPKTGDYIMIAVAVMLVSAAGLAGAYFYNKKRKR